MSLEMSKKVAIHTLCQFFKFGIVGVSNTVLSYAVYAVCVLLGFHYLLANGLGFAVGITNAFYWSNKYVFAEEACQIRSMAQTFLKLCLAYSSTGIFLNSCLLYLLVEWYGISSLTSQLICLTVSVPINFVINKFWTYKTCL